MSAPTIQVLYFASLRTHLGIESERIALPLTPASGAAQPTVAPSSLAALPAYIVASHAASADPAQTQRILGSCLWSVNEEMVDSQEVERTQLQGGDVVAAIPPVSGG